MTGLQSFATSFAIVGWFIPPYVRLGILDKLAKQIVDTGAAFDQLNLERALFAIYSPAHLAAMVLERYPVAPIIQSYKVTIAEAVEAHFLGLDHIAVGGLVPVVEGAGRQLAAARGITDLGIKPLFKALASDCAEEVTRKQLGEWREVTSMLESFATFASDYLYASSTSYPLADKTNRHGITHGAYTDSDYGRPLNFYKTIGAVDFLTFVSSFRANISWFAPNPTSRSSRLATYYQVLGGLKKLRSLRPDA